MKGFYGDIIPCWLIPPLSSLHSPSDTCHSLIGWEKAQSMCFSLIQSGPFLSLPPSCHPDRRSSNPSAYKLNPLPSLFNTIHFSTLIMPLCHPNPSWVKLLLPYCPPFITSFYIHHPQSMKHVLNYWAHISHIQSNRPISKTRKTSLREPLNGSRSQLRACLCLSWGLCFF